MLKATIVIILSVVLCVGVVSAIRSKAKSATVRGVIAGSAVLLLVIALKPEKGA